MTRKSALALFAAALLAAVPVLAQVETGSADFTRYVSMGDSLTAGFASGGLALDSQATSYPQLIYNQAKGTAGGFEQPIVSNPGIPSQLFLASLIPLAIAPQPGQGLPVNLSLPRPYDNISVPGADVNDLINTVTDGGGMHDLILRGLGTQLLQGLSLSPTFVTLWIGNNDALGAAVSGIVIDGVTLTSLADFEARFRTATSTIAGSGAQMAIATVSPVTAIPFVTTLPYVLIDPVSREPILIGGQPVPLIGPNGLLTPADYVLLTAQDELAVGKGIPVALGGTGQPLSDSVVLNATEANTIISRVNQYNEVVRTVANETGAALIDVGAFFESVNSEGLSYGGIEYTTEFVTGGLFSYDGVHGSKMGYALIANLFIEGINEQFGAEIPPVNLRPFVFGGPAPFASGVDPTSVKLSAGFQNNLLSSLGFPPVETLMEIKQRRGGEPGPGRNPEVPKRPRRFRK